MPFLVEEASANVELLLGWAFFTKIQSMLQRNLDRPNLEASASPSSLGHGSFVTAPLHWSSHTKAVRRPLGPSDASSQCATEHYLAGALGQWNPSPKLLSPPPCSRRAHNALVTFSFFLAMPKSYKNAKNWRNFTVFKYIYKKTCKKHSVFKCFCV